MALVMAAMGVLVAGEDSACTNPFAGASVGLQLTGPTDANETGDWFHRMLTWRCVES